VSDSPEGRSIVPDWKTEIRRRLAKLKLEPTRKAAIIEELAQYLGDCYEELLASGVAPAEAYWGGPILMDTSVA
jgi:hypothetical protein